jgi:hypothetical protein
VGSYASESASKTFDERVYPKKFPKNSMERSHERVQADYACSHALTVVTTFSDRDNCRLLQRSRPQDDFVITAALRFEPGRRRHQAHKAVDVIGADRGHDGNLPERRIAQP